MWFEEEIYKCANVCNVLLCCHFTLYLQLSVCFELLDNLCMAWAPATHLLKLYMCMGICVPSCAFVFVYICIYFNYTAVCVLIYIVDNGCSSISPYDRKILSLTVLLFQSSWLRHGFRDRLPKYKDTSMRYGRLEA